MPATTERLFQRNMTNLQQVFTPEYLSLFR